MYYPQRRGGHWRRDWSPIRVLEVGDAWVDPLAVAALLQRRHRERYPVTSTLCWTVYLNVSLQLTNGVAPALIEGEYISGYGPPNKILLTMGNRYGDDEEPSRRSSREFQPPCQMDPH